MLKSLSLSAANMPISGQTYEDIQTVSSRGEGFSAAGRMAFRESLGHNLALEAAIYKSSMEMLGNFPEQKARYESDVLADATSLDVAAGGGSVSRQADRYLPRFGPEEFKRMGFEVPEGFEFQEDGKMSQPRFYAYLAAYQDQQADAQTVERMPDGLISGAASLGGSLAYSLADPINLIPFGSGINRAKQAGEMGKAARQAFYGQAIKAGAKEGMIGAAVADAISFPLANRWGADVGLDDALSDIVISGVFGAFFGTLGAGLELHSYDKLAKSHKSAMEKSLADLENGLSVDVESVLSPLLGEARVKQKTRLEDPVYLRRLSEAELEVIRQDVDMFGRQLQDLKNNNWRESAKLGTGPNSPDGPRLILGDAPVVLRMLGEEHSSLELPVDLARRLIADEKWQGLNIEELPGAMAQPVAVIELADSRKAVLTDLPGKDGQRVPVLVELGSAVKEIFKQKRPATKFDAISEIQQVHLLEGDGAEAAVTLAKEGTPLFVNKERVREVDGISGSAELPSVVSKHPHGFNGPGRVITVLDFEQTIPAVRIEIFNSLIERRDNGEFSLGRTKYNIANAGVEKLSDVFQTGLVISPSGHKWIDLSVNEQTGWSAVFQKRGIAHLAQLARNEADILAISAVPELWQTAVYDLTGDWRSKGEDGTRQVTSSNPNHRAAHNFKNQIKIKGEVYDVEIMVRESSDGQAYYSHTLKKQKVQNNDIFEKGKKEESGSRAKVQSLKRWLNSLSESGSSVSMVTKNRGQVKTEKDLSVFRAKEDMGIDLDSGPVFGQSQVNAEAEMAVVKQEAEVLASRANEDPGTAIKAQELEMELAEQRLQEMNDRGELSEAEADFLENGSQGDGEDAVLGRAAEAQEMEKAQAIVSGTECVVGGFLDGVSKKSS